MTKSSFYSLLKITLFESFFMFDGKFYERCNGVVIGSPLGPILADVFMCHFENIWLENCPARFKLIVCRQFVVFFRSKCRLNTLFRFKGLPGEKKSLWNNLSLHV